KYFVLDFETCPPDRKTTKNSIPHQHLGVAPGKPNNNAVKDVKKLELAAGTHVSFLLVRHESVKRSGGSDVQRFKELANLIDPRWTEYYGEWTHPRHPRLQVKCHLFCRPIWCAARAEKTALAQAAAELPIGSL